MKNDETIAAIATAPGRGGVAIVRVSGINAHAIAKALTRKDVRVGKISFATIYDSPRDDALAIDDAVVLAFAKPHSYTGEDVVEFQCHGGFVTPRRVLNACFAAGARLAMRGEFTERAFLNGCLTLDQAQAVLDLIDARTSRAADVATRVLRDDNAKDLSRLAIREIYDEALDLSATIEHALDVSEDELSDEFFSRLNNDLVAIRARIARAIRARRERKILRAGALVVLAGVPNAGKSSLMNALLKENRAIVSDVPGTTRDTIEEWIDLDGWPVRLADTAGLRETDDSIEAEGVRRTEALLATADIILRLSDDENFFANREKNEKEIFVLTKADLLATKCVATNVVAISSRTGFGLDSLRENLIASLSRLADRDDGAIANDEDEVNRELATLLAADESLVASKNFIATDLVLAGNAVRRAATMLGELAGATYSADLLSRVFSRFCVGK